MTDTHGPDDIHRTADTHRTACATDATPTARRPRVPVPRIPRAVATVGAAAGAFVLTLPAAFSAGGADPVDAATAEDPARAPGSAEAEPAGAPAYPPPAAPLAAHARHHPQSFTAALRGARLTRSATPPPTSRPGTVLLDVYGAGSAPDGGRVDALDYSLTVHLGRHLRADGTCTMVTLGADGVAHRDARAGSVACTATAGGRLTATVHRGAPGTGQLLAGLWPVGSTTVAPTTAVPYTVEVSRAVARRPSGDAYFRQGVTAAEYDPC